MHGIIEDPLNSIAIRIKKFLNLCKNILDCNNFVFDKQIDFIREAKKKNFLDKEKKSLTLTYNYLKFDEKMNKIKFHSKKNLEIKENIEENLKKHSFDLNSNLFVDKITFHHCYFDFVKDIERK